jgi:hypothetical protein
MNQTNLFENAFIVNDCAGVAWFAHAYKPLFNEFGEEDGCDESIVIARMVGDDKDTEIEVSEITMIEDDKYCGGCGQVGCCHG